MEDPIKVVNAASAVTQDAWDDSTVATAVGLSRDALAGTETEKIATLSCAGTGGLAAVSRTLSVFSDGLEVVQDIGAAPEDTSNAGYIRQFKKNAGVLADSGDADAAKKAAAKLVAQLQQAEMRCKTLLAADLAPSTALGSASAPRLAALPVIFGQVLAVDQLIKLFLGSAEKWQREAAVRAAVKDLHVQFDAAAKELKREPGPSFGPVVLYGVDASAEATDANRTALGAAVTIRRWMVAKTMQQQWQALADCRHKSGAGCLGDAQKLSLARDFATNAKRYRALSKLDPKKVHDGIDAAVAGAMSSTQIQGIGGFLDVLVGLASTLSDFEDAYTKYAASK